MADGAVYRETEQAWTGPLVVSVQSRVAMGHVGNSAAVFPLQLAGYEVVDVPTALLSNHPFYPGHTGRLLDAPLVAELLAGVAARGIGRAASAVVSGFLGTAPVAPAVAAFVTDARRGRDRGGAPPLRYVCDPVLGDVGPGLYVDPGLVAAYRELLVPLADVLTPNPFELELLAGAGPATVAGVQDRADTLLGDRPGAVVVTGASLADTPPDALDTVVVTAEVVRATQVRGTWRVRSPRVDRHFDGTGDVFTALLTAAWLTAGATPDAVQGAAAAAAAGTGRLVARTVADRTKELQLVAVGADLLTAPTAPPRRLR